MQSGMKFGIWNGYVLSKRGFDQRIEGLFLLGCCRQPQKETRAGAIESFQIHIAHVLGFQDQALHSQSTYRYLRVS